MAASGVGTLNETHLHAALKQRYAEPGDLIEATVDGFVVDIMRGDRLIEIQTRSFRGLRTKLDRLLDRYRVRIVHPVPATKWIVKGPHAGRPASRRRSPKAGSAHDVFAELVSFPWLLDHPHLALDVVLTEEEEIRRFDGKSWRRKGWSTVDRRLLAVGDTVAIERPADLLGLVPEGLPQPFTTAELAGALGRPRRLAQQMAYCLRECGLLASDGKDGNAVRYRCAREL